MSQSTTSGGGRRAPALALAARAAPPERSAARSVARMSMRAAARDRAGSAGSADSASGRRHAADEPLGARQLLGRHLLEIHLLQQLARRRRSSPRRARSRSPRVRSSRRLALRRRAAPRRGGGSSPRPRARVRRARSAGSSSAIIFSSSCGLRQKMWKAWSKSVALVVPVDEDRMQRPVEIAAVADADGAHRLDSAASTWPGPIGRPAARSVRAKYMMLARSRPRPGRRLGCRPMSSARRRAPRFT